MNEFCSVFSHQQVQWLQIETRSAVPPLVPTLDSKLDVSNFTPEGTALATASTTTTSSSSSTSQSSLSSQLSSYLILSNFCLCVDVVTDFVDNFEKIQEWHNAESVSIPAEVQKFFDEF
jgi:hypothetical protein